MRQVGLTKSSGGRFREGIYRSGTFENINPAVGGDRTGCRSRWTDGKKLPQILAEYIYVQDYFVLPVIVFAGYYDYWDVLGAAFPLVAGGYSFCLLYLQHVILPGVYWVPRCCFTCLQRVSASSTLSMPPPIPVAYVEPRPRLFFGTELLHKITI